MTSIEIKEMMKLFNITWDEAIDFVHQRRKELLAKGGEACYTLEGKEIWFSTEQIKEAHEEIKILFGIK